MRRIKSEPAVGAAIELQPRMTLSRRLAHMEITADVAAGDPPKSQKRQGDVRKVLTHAGTFEKHIGWSPDEAALISGIGTPLDGQLRMHAEPRLGHVLSEDALNYIIRRYTREAGVRGLERVIGRLSRKRARQVVEGQTLTDELQIDEATALLGRRLAELSPGSPGKRIYFCQSGAAAVEAAIKGAR